MKTKKRNIKEIGLLIMKISKNKIHKSKKRIPKINI